MEAVHAGIYMYHRQNTVYVKNVQILHRNLGRYSIT